MNIEGVVRQLALFDPPIDPGALVQGRRRRARHRRASSNNLNQPVSTIRGPTAAAEGAWSCAAEVKSLGAARADGDREGRGRAPRAAAPAARAEHAQPRPRRALPAVEGGRGRDRGAARAAARRCGSATATTRGSSARATATSTRSRRVDLARAELTEETFDAAYGALVDAYAGALPREAYRKETSVGGLMEFAGETVVERVRRRARQDAAAQQERERRAEHLPADLRHVRHGRRRCSTSPRRSSALIPQFAVHATPLGVGGAADVRRRPAVEGGEVRRRGARR